MVDRPGINALPATEEQKIADSLVEVPKADHLADEPALSVGIVQAVVVAAIGLGVAFGLPISDDIQSAILGFLAPAWVLIAALRIRGKVYAPSTVHDISVDAAVESGNMYGPE